MRSKGSQFEAWSSTTWHHWYSRHVRYTSQCRLLKIRARLLKIRAHKGSIEDPFQAEGLLKEKNQRKSRSSSNNMSNRSPFVIEVPNKQHLIQIWQKFWNTQCHLTLWFDNWEVFKAEKQFTKWCTDRSLHFLENQKCHIIYYQLNETNLSFNGNDRGNGGFSPNAIHARERFQRGTCFFCFLI